MCCVLTSGIYDRFSYKVYIIRSFQVDEDIKIFRIVMLFRDFFSVFAAIWLRKPGFLSGLLQSKILPQKLTRQ